jgi:glyoxylase-like metal-dependent hydrolase (beta-lactamase superfamily II)
MHRRTELDLAKYDDPDEAVDRRELMLADHGLYGPELTETSRGLCDWLPVMPSIGRPSTLLDGGERVTVGDRTWEIVHTPGHSPGHVCLWSAEDRLLCSGDHLLQMVSPPVTFERGFETDPMGSYLASLERVAALAPDVVLPGHGTPFRHGARRAVSISRNKLRRLTQIREMVEERERTVTELTAELFPTALTAAQRHFAMAELLAYLAHHEVRGVLARARRPDGVFVWRPAGSG